jgi:hypothetical protein
MPLDPIAVSLWTSGYHLCGRIRTITGGRQPQVRRSARHDHESRRFACAWRIPARSQQLAALPRWIRPVSQVVEIVRYPD